MKTIYKYPLEIELNLICLPEDNDILHVGLDPSGTLCLWALIDTDSEIEERSIDVVGTGHPCQYLAMQYLGSVVQGPFVWHVFDAK